MISANTMTTERAVPVFYFQSTKVYANGIAPPATANTAAEASGGNYNAATGVVTWTVDSVAAHQTGSRTFQAKVE